jgi:hypothetical protein
MRTSMSSSLIGILGAAACCNVAIAASSLISIDPPYLQPILVANDHGTVHWSATFNNQTGAQIDVSAYLDDDPACPATSAHSWITFSFHPYQVPATGADYVISGDIAFDSTGLALGRYGTNLCIVDDITHAVPVNLTVAPGSLVPTSGLLTSISPSLIGAIVHPGGTGSMLASATVENNGGSAIDVFVYLQDDPACPVPASVHDWVSFPTSDFSVPHNTSQSIGGTVAFNASGKTSGIYHTYLCIYQSLGSPVTTALPVQLRVAPDDEIFQDDLG